jgi:hypothetical protein
MAGLESVPACFLFCKQNHPRSSILGGPRLFSCSGDANGPICDATMVHQAGFRISDTKYLSVIVLLTSCWCREPWSCVLPSIK